MPVDHPLVALELRTPLAVVRLDEPERRNPLSPVLVRSLTEVLSALEADPNVRALVITGTGTAFCAGADLHKMRSDKPLEDRRHYDDILALNRLVWNYRKPTIAAVNGYALGAGANLVTWCDLAIADESAQLGYPEVRAGVASATVVASLLRCIGRKAMYHLLLTGDHIGAVDAVRLGLVNEVAPRGRTLEVALALAGRIAEHAPSAIAMTKEAVRTLTDSDYDLALEHGRDIRVLSRLDPSFTSTLDHYLPGTTPQESQGPP